MTTTRSALTGEEISTDSEQHRHECECRWLLTHKPTRQDKHLYLYGVHDRERLMGYNKTGQRGLADDYTKRWDGLTRPLLHNRGLAAVDRILADARIIYEKRK